MSLSLLEKDRRYIWHPYTQMLTAPAPLPIVRAKDTLLYDDQGNAYIDAVASWWVNPHGHAKEYIAKKVLAQMLELEHVIFAGFTHRPAVELAERLLKVLPSNQSKVFFSDNGSTAVEIGIKMAIQYFHNLGKPRSRLIAFDHGFHGETFGAMSASGDLSLNNPFKKQLFSVDRIPVPVPGKEAESIQALKKALAGGDVYAFLFEPLVLGAGGMLMYEPEVLDELITICHENDVLCIADEVMTGFGRTGKLFACNYLKTSPDIMCLSKCLTGGTLPMATTICTQDIFDAFLSEDKYKTFFHGHSYTANPVGCAAALASLDLFEDPACWEQIRMIEASHKKYQEKIKDHPRLRAIRQRGTILALEFSSPEDTSYFNEIRDQLYDFFLKNGVLLRPLGNVIYIMPPYCITKEQLNKVYQLIKQALDQF